MQECAEPSLQSFERSQDYPAHPRGSDPAPHLAHSLLQCVLLQVKEADLSVVPECLSALCC